MSVLTIILYACSIVLTIGSPLTFIEVLIKKGNPPSLSRLLKQQSTFQHSTITDWVINAFYKITGVPVLVNTSMNVRGEPIVNTLEQAYSMIIKTDMDYIVLGNYIVKKQ